MWIVISCKIYNEEINDKQIVTETLWLCPDCFVKF